MGSTQQLPLATEIATALGKKDVLALGVVIASSWSCNQNFSTWQTQHGYRTGAEYWGQMIAI